MSTNIILNKEDSIIAHYFPNERMVDSFATHTGGLCFSKWEGTLEEWCKLIWSYEAIFWNRSRFIFKYGCVPK
jgi:hypothetical protein